LLTLFLSFKLVTFYWLQRETIRSNMITVQYTGMTSIFNKNSKNT
jgi:hypothetical protein